MKPRWIESISPEDFLSKALVVSNIPYDGDVDLIIRGLEIEELDNDHCVFLAKLCKYIDPLHVFEIGTEHGKSASICVKNSNGLVTTTSLAKEYRDTYTRIGKQYKPILSINEIGKYYVMNELQSRVRQLYENPSQLNMDRLYYGDEIDIAIINGTHEESHIFRDTEMVYNYVKDGGVILWDDFTPELIAYPYVQGVINGIKKIINETTIKPVWIEKTGWAGFIKEQ